MTTPCGGPESELLLDDVWCLYHHHTGDADWNFDSYHLLTCVSSAEEFWASYGALQDRMASGMFFLTREHVFPCWDDPNNIGGGCLSVKVANPEAAAYWHRLATQALCEQLPDATGISCSPRTHFCIFKVWLSDGGRQEEVAGLLPRGYMGAPLFKSNRDNIRMDQERLRQPEHGAAPGTA